jgi:septum formation protein
VKKPDSNEQKIILASSSAYRQQLLSKLGIDFECDAPSIDETALPDESAQDLVGRLALQKTQAVAKRHPSGLIIGSDQVALHPSGIVGKPIDYQDAIQQLLEVSGSKVSLYTGLVLLDSKTGEYQQTVVPFEVCFRKIDLTMIEAYLELEKPYDCAGSLKAEGLGIWLIEKFVGDDPNTLIGLPLIELISMLTNVGYPFLGNANA